VLARWAVAWSLAWASQGVSFGSEIQVPILVGENMVLQQPSQDRPTIIHCWSDAKSLELKFGGSKPKRKQTDDQWSYSFKELPAGGPTRLEIRADPTRKPPGPQVIIENVYVGEVWLWGAGEGNLKLRATNSFDAEQIKRLHSMVFFLNFQRLDELRQRSPSGREWKPCNPTNDPAAACFFAERLTRDRKIPMGIIIVPAEEVIYNLKDLKKPGRTPSQDTREQYPDPLVLAQAIAEAARTKVLANQVQENYLYEVNQLKLKGEAPTLAPPPQWTADFNQVYSPDPNLLSVRGVIW
jgi:hypothetical protein